MQTLAPTARKWTRADYLRMAEMGLFEGSRVELIEGQVLEMPPQRNLHYVAMELVKRLLEKAFGKKHWVRSQGPLDLSADSSPEPDLAVITGQPRDFQNHPATALLIVEISDSTLDHDLRRKAALYARAGIADYWVLDLQHRRLHVHRAPVGIGRKSARYTENTTPGGDAAIAPIAAPKARLKIADMLP